MTTADRDKLRGTPSSYGVSSERVTDDQIHTLAEHVGVCVRPIVRRVTDNVTGETSLVPIPCGSTRARICTSCAVKARRVRIQQCRDGWHRIDDPERDDATGSSDLDELGGLDEPGTPGEDADNAASGDGSTGAETNENGETAESEESLSRRVRSTKRRQDTPNLPTAPKADTTIGRSFAGNDGRTYRPSMFLTFTLPSYGRVRSDGTPRHPSSYDYRRAALDAMHFPKLIDRLFQNLRRCAGYQVQYFATVEPQTRLALHLHAAIRGTIPRRIVRQVVDATYHQLWWPAHDEPVYTGTRLPVWDEGANGYVDPTTHAALPTWDKALKTIDDDPDAGPAHVIRLGNQFDYQGIVATNEREISRSVGYLTKYLTKSVAETYDPDTITARQKAHRDRLHAEVRYLPCTPECANWLRFGIQPKDAEPDIRPGECERPAHHLDNLGHGGRRVLVSRDWSGKRIPEHKADRACVVRETLTAAGVEMPDQDRYAADATTDDGDVRYTWEPVDITRDTTPHAYRDLIRQSIQERLAWRNQYERARQHPVRARPPDERSAILTASTSAT